MADVEETFDNLTILAIIVAVIVGGYIIYKALKGSLDSLGKAFGLQGAQCVICSITNPGQVTTAQADAIKKCQEKTFPGVCKKTVDANVDWGVAAINRQNACGPNWFQYGVNYWFGSHFGECCTISKARQAAQANKSCNTQSQQASSCTCCCCIELGVPQG